MICHGHPDQRKSIQHVKLGQVDSGVVIHCCGVFKNDEIEVTCFKLSNCDLEKIMGSSFTASSLSPSGYAHFSAEFLQCFADIPKLLCWERSTADSCRIRLDNTNDVPNIKGIKS